MKEFLEKIGYVRYETRVDFWNSTAFGDRESPYNVLLNEDFPCYLKRVEDFDCDNANIISVVFDRLDVEVLG